MKTLTNTACCLASSCEHYHLAYFGVSRYRISLATQMIKHANVGDNFVRAELKNNPDIQTYRLLASSRD